MSKIISIGATHGEGEEIIFHLREISVAEETRYTSQFGAINDLDSEEKKAEKEYGIITEALASWSEKNPTIIVGGKDTAESPQPEGYTAPATPADAVRAYFAEKTPAKERTAQQVVIRYRNKLQPKVVFY